MTVKLFPRVYDLFLRVISDHQGVKFYTTRLSFPGSETLHNLIVCFIGGFITGKPQVVGMRLKVFKKNGENSKCWSFFLLIVNYSE